MDIARLFDRPLCTGIKTIRGKLIHYILELASQIGRRLLSWIGRKCGGL